MLKPLYLLLTILVPLLAQAQTTVKGRITDVKKRPIAGVNIAIKGSYDGATSAKDGSFSFTTSATGERILTASLTGYQTLEIKAVLGPASPISSSC